MDQLPVDNIAASPTVKAVFEAGTGWLGIRRPYADLVPGTGTREQGAQIRSYWPLYLHLVVHYMFS